MRQYYKAYEAKHLKGSSSAYERLRACGLSNEEIERLKRSWNGRELIKSYLATKEDDRLKLVSNRQAKKITKTW